MARTQAVHCESVGGPHRARQARCWHPLALVNRPLFGRLGPHPALRRPSPGSDSGPTACWQGGVSRLGSSCRKPSITSIRWWVSWDPKALGGRSRATGWRPRLLGAAIVQHRLVWRRVKTGMIFFFFS